MAAHSDVVCAEDTVEDETDAADESDASDDDAAFVEAPAAPVAADEWPRRNQGSRETLDTSLLNCPVDNAAAVRPYAGRHCWSHQPAYSDAILPCSRSFLVDY